MSLLALRFGILERLPLSPKAPTLNHASQKLHGKIRLLWLPFSVEIQ
jgi:hypothetical protein